MLNNKGSTLIESLFAFEIYVSILIVFTGLFIQVYNQETKILKKYNDILEKERLVYYEDEFSEIIKMVLH